MSARPSITVWCDRQGCPGNFQVDHATPDEARAKAKESGWVVIHPDPAVPHTVENTQDICPRHTPRGPR